MTRNPDDDIEAKRLDLAMRESNLAVHKTELDRAEDFLGIAQKRLHGLPEQPDPMSEAILLATIAGALGSVRTARLYVEAEEQQVHHLRAHVDFHDGKVAQGEKLRSIVDEATAQMAERLRASGIDVQQLPGLGLMVRPPEEPEGPNT